ncbi:MAG: hypothetical protein E6Q60_09500 [Nitrosomonas oligotropha]|uniref:Cthe-2314-like HEPN domain-containing protein n=1 Tax=Nitrosomonas oligotropha TaxID=42354 RepID=A0A5C7VQ48_9PROT|nr:MAG: hypothetical protein E6Q60_09500 [Nitrosomonas oligotropha]
MNIPTLSYHQLGVFIVSFQHIEEAVNDLLELLAVTDSEVVRILVNELEYSKRLKTADVLFAYFVDTHGITPESTKDEFHKLITELGKLGERRNELVHSKYNPWINIDGHAGLLRRNSKLRGSKGEREVEEEELQPDDFTTDLIHLQVISNKLEELRLKVIDWRYPISESMEKDK